MVIKGYSLSEWLDMLTEPIQSFFFNRRLKKYQPELWEKLNQMEEEKRNIT